MEVLLLECNQPSGGRECEKVHARPKAAPSSLPPPSSILMSPLSLPSGPCSYLEPRRPLLGSIIAGTIKFVRPG